MSIDNLCFHEENRKNTYLAICLIWSYDTAPVVVVEVEVISV